jgi:hypothetical protein
MPTCRPVRGGGLCWHCLCWACVEPASKCQRLHSPTRDAIIHDGFVLTRVLSGIIAIMTKRPCSCLQCAFWATGTLAALLWVAHHVKKVRQMADQTGNVVVLV